MKSISRYFRLLPAVILLGGGLLVLKGVTLVEDARAQTAMTGQAPVPAPKDTTHVAVTDPVIDDSEANSAAEVDVLTSLSKRRQQLDARAQSLDMQSNLLAATEQRIDGKIAMLKQLQAQMQTLLGQRDAAEQKQLTDLVKSYSSMKPADAARIFNSLDDTVRLNVAAQMKSDVLGAILAKMQPDPAQKLTVELANRLKAPDTTAAQLAAATTSEPPAAQQMASVDPSAQTPAANTPAATPPDAATSPANPPPAAPSAQPPAPANAPQQAAATKDTVPAQKEAAPPKAPAANAKPDPAKQAAAKTPAQAPAPKTPAPAAKGG